MTLLFWCQFSILVTFIFDVTKISDRNNLREEGFMLAQGFRGFSPRFLVLPHDFGQNIMAVTVCGKGAFSLHGGLE
jgi:hypothetical protein